jgi:hypothetical protein
MVKEVKITQTNKVNAKKAMEKKTSKTTAQII